MEIEALRKLEIMYSSSCRFVGQEIQNSLDKILVNSILKLMDGEFIRAAVRQQTTGLFSVEGSYARIFCCVGIDQDHPDKLITTGVFAFSRNPIYVAFAFILLGQFLVFSNWILLLNIGAAVWLFHRQVLREEDFLKKHYGKEYSAYCNRVRRYL